MVVLVSGVAVKRNRELLDGRWDKHDTKDAANIADLISQWVSPDHPRLWPGHFGQGDRRPGQSLPFSKPEAGAQAGRLGFERRPERENLGFGDPGYFLLRCEVWSPPRAHRRRPSLFSFASIFHLLSSIFSSRQAYRGGAFKK
jgi:hypothetical protein